VDRNAVLWFAPGLAVCKTVGADPWGTLASGTLLAAFPAAEASGAVTALTRSGYETAVVGRVTAGEGVEDEAGQAIPWPDRDEVARVLSTQEEKAGLGTI
jgi:hydrogenase maturation factor